jgi:hypothetical protein
MSRYSSAMLELPMLDPPMLDEPGWLAELGLDDVDVLAPLEVELELPVEPELDEEAPVRSTFVSLYIALVPVAPGLLVVELPVLLALAESRSTQPVNETVCAWLLLDVVLPDCRVPL